MTEVEVSQLFVPRFCPKCGGKMGHKAQRLCHDCQATENLEKTANMRIHRMKEKEV